jgi:hypothetical protein
MGLSPVHILRFLTKLRDDPLDDAPEFTLSPDMEDQAA